jgi:phosphoglycolate phosphatase
LLFQKKESKRMLNYDLIIFDLDGTLLDSAQDVLICVNEVRKMLGLTALDLEQIKRGIGPGPDIFAEIAFGKKNWQRKDEILSMYRTLYSENMLKTTRPFKGIVDLLERIKGCQLAVATNKRLLYSRQIIEELHLLKYFDLLAGPESVAKVKPDPAMIEYIMHTLKAAPEKTLVVGDTTNDILAARNAHAKSCSVAWGYSSVADLQSAGPDFMIKEPIDLLRVIGIA